MLCDPTDSQSLHFDPYPPPAPNYTLYPPRGEVLQFFWAGEGRREGRMFRGYQNLWLLLEIDELKKPWQHRKKKYDPPVLGFVRNITPQNVTRFYFSPYSCLPAPLRNLSFGWRCTSSWTRRLGVRQKHMIWTLLLLLVLNVASNLAMRPEPFARRGGSGRGVTHMLPLGPPFPFEPREDHIPRISIHRP